VVLVGGGHFHRCLSLVQEQLGAKLHGHEPMALPAAALAAGQEFWGISLLFHATHFLALVVPSLPFPSPSPSDLIAAGPVLCATPWETMLQLYVGKDPNTPKNRMFGRCFDVALTVALLGGPHGWGFPPDSRLVRMVQNVSGMEAEWSLGAAVTMMHEMEPTPPDRRPQGPRRSILGLLLLSAGFLLVAAALWWGRCRTPRWPHPRPRPACV